MKVSEWKLENSVVVGDDNYEFLSDIRLLSGEELVKGSKFMDAILDDPHGPMDGATVYFMDSELELLEITEDPEWDDDLEVAIQNFKVNIKTQI